MSRRVLAAVTIMAIALFMAALAFRGSFPDAGGRGHAVTDAVKVMIEAFGSNGAALLFLVFGGALAALVLRFARG